MSRFTFARGVRTDLRGIWRRIAIEHHSPDAADRLIDRITEVFALLAREPLLGEPQPFMLDCAHTPSEVRELSRFGEGGSLSANQLSADLRSCHFARYFRGIWARSVPVHGIGNRLFGKDNCVMIMARAKSREQLLCEIMGFCVDNQFVTEDLIQERFHRSPYLPLRYIECRLSDGTLVLRGRVPTYYLKQLAQTVARSLNGICCVVNELRVDFPKRRAS